MRLTVLSLDPFQITMPTQPLAPNEELTIDLPPLDVIYGAPALLQGTGINVRGQYPLGFTLTAEDGMSLQALVELLSNQGFAAALSADWHAAQAKLLAKPLFDGDLPDFLFLVAAANSL